MTGITSESAGQGRVPTRHANVLIRILAVAIACGAALVAIAVIHALLVRLGRRLPIVADLTGRTHRPVVVFVLSVVLEVSLRHTGWSGYWLRILTHAVEIVAIGAAAWVVAALLLVVEDAALLRFRVDVQDYLSARAVHTQIQLLRRVTVAAVVMLSLIGALFTFREARLIGTSLLASAGVAAAVIGFAAQSLFGNVLAGIQITFGGGLRLDDVVVIGGEWGRIEDIRLTYVVVPIWDDRRLVLPTSYFTTTPFENWTRTGSSLLGTVEFEVDWSVPVESMRDELRRLLTENRGVWDGPGQRAAGDGRGTRAHPAARPAQRPGRRYPLGPALPGTGAAGRLAARPVPAGPAPAAHGVRRTGRDGPQ